MKEFKNLLISFKNLKTKKKTETQLKKEENMKTVDKLHKNYFNVYKSDYDTDEWLKGDKKIKFDYKQFELGD